jgi:hypothetical protein
MPVSVCYGKVRVIRAVRDSADTGSRHTVSLLITLCVLALHTEVYPFTSPPARSLFSELNAIAPIALPYGMVRLPVSL